MWVFCMSPPLVLAALLFVVCPPVLNNNAPMFFMYSLVPYKCWALNVHSFSISLVNPTVMWREVAFYLFRWDFLMPCNFLPKVSLRSTSEFSTILLNTIYIGLKCALMLKQKTGWLTQTQRQRCQAPLPRHSVFLDAFQALFHSNSLPSCLCTPTTKGFN